MEQLTCHEKLLFLYFSVNPRQTPCGVIEVSIRRIILETGLPEKQVPQLIENLCKPDSSGSRHVTWFKQHSRIFVHNWYRHQCFNANFTISAKKCVESLPIAIQQVVSTEHPALCGIAPSKNTDTVPNHSEPFGTVYSFDETRDTHPNQDSTGQSQDSTEEGMAGAGPAATSDSAVEEPFQEEPKTPVRTGRASTPREFVGYYIDAFRKATTDIDNPQGRDPILGPKEIGLLRTFAKKCGKENVYAEAIAGFFSDDKWAAGEGFSVNCLASQQPDKWIAKKRSTNGYHANGTNGHRPSSGPIEIPMTNAEAVAKFCEEL